MTARDASSYEVASLTWDRVGERLREGAPAILPLGAGAKEHGLHMPMHTDQVFAEHFARVLAEKTDALIWPTLTYGFYPAFVAYAGSVSLSIKTFKTLVAEISDAILGFGVRIVFILDTGLSTIAPVDEAIQLSRDPSRVRHVPIFRGPRFLATAHDLMQQPYGSHADEIETSLMLTIAPSLVDLARAKPSLLSAEGPMQGPLSPDDPTSPNYSLSGGYGDPTLASIDKGSRLFAAILRDLSEVANAREVRL
jgi:creatinine amidohydrolase